MPEVGCDRVSLGDGFFVSQLSETVLVLLQLWEDGVFVSLLVPGTEHINSLGGGENAAAEGLCLLVRLCAGGVCGAQVFP